MPRRISHGINRILKVWGELDAYLFHAYNRIMKNMSYNLGLLSKYRPALMGAATIGILMCHAPAHGVNLPWHLNAILGLGQMGVMIFFLVSGLGLYYSTRQMEYSVSGIAAWYRKRLVRLFVPYLIIYAPALYISMSDTSSLDWGGYILNLLTVSYWIDKTGCWFVDILVPIYLLTPLWNRLLGRLTYPIIPTALIFAAMMAVDSTYAAAFHQAAFFFIGFWLGRYVKQGVCLSLREIMATGCFFALLLAGYYCFGIGALLPIIVIPCVCLGCLALEKVGSGFLVRFLDFFGTISLESYLLNVTLITWITYFNLLPAHWFPYRYLFIVVAGVLLSVVVNRLSKAVIGKSREGNARLQPIQKGPHSSQ